MAPSPKAASVLLLLIPLAGCSGPAEESTESSAPAAKVEHRLAEVATSDRQWTGLAVGAGGRTFVTFPRWSDDVPVSVGEVVDGQVVPYPDEELNAWTAKDGDPTRQFICAQSVLADSQGAIWVLDPAHPAGGELVDSGPKLMRFNLTLNRQVGVYRFQFEDPNDDVVTPESYLNDVRVDLDAGAAYITDSGDGAIIVLDLKKGTSRRRLDDHPSTEAEETTLTVGGAPWEGPDGESRRIHSDGIALSPDGKQLYYQALTGRTLYRVPTEALRDRGLSEEDLGAKVKKVAETGPADGLIFGTDGWLYISAIEENAIKRLDPDSGKVETVVQDQRILWPDSFAVDPEGRVMFTTSQIHLGDQATEPYRILRIDQVPAGTP